MSADQWEAKIFLTLFYSYQNYLLLISNTGIDSQEAMMGNIPVGILTRTSSQSTDHKRI